MGRIEVKKILKENEYNVYYRIKRGFVKLEERLKNLPVFWFIIIMLLINYLVANIALFDFLPDHNGARPHFRSKRNEIIESVFIGPLFETLLYQKIIISLCECIPFFKNRKYFSIFISAFVFAWNHTYSLRYAAKIFFSGGITLSYAYVVYKEKGKNSYWIVYTIHGIWNLLIYILNHYL